MWCCIKVKNICAIATKKSFLSYCIYRPQAVTCHYYYSCAYIINRALFTNQVQQYNFEFIYYCPISSFSTLYVIMWSSNKKSALTRHRRSPMLYCVTRTAIWIVLLLQSILMLFLRSFFNLSFWRCNLFLVNCLDTVTFHGLVIARIKVILQLLLLYGYHTAQQWSEGCYYALHT